MRLVPAERHCPASAFAECLFQPAFSPNNSIQSAACARLLPVPEGARALGRIPPLGEQCAAVAIGRMRHYRTKVSVLQTCLRQKGLQLREIGICPKSGRCRPQDIHEFVASC